MFGFLKNLAQRWNDWCGDREMELAIRKHLTKEGYYGNTAQLKNVRLVAVQRPGWLQVYRFEATVRVTPPDGSDDQPDAPAEYRDLYGLVREDVRKNRSDVRVFDLAGHRNRQFDQWSEGLICLRGAQGLGTGNIR